METNNNLTVALKRLRPPDGETWALQPSQTGGQGIFSGKDIKSGEVVFIDSPIVTGPRSIEQLAACVVCYRMDKPLGQCKNECGLPLCKDCQNLVGDVHGAECELLRILEPAGDSWSWPLFRALITVRCLFMSDLERCVVGEMHANKGEGVKLQMRNLIKSLNKQLTPEQIAWMTHCTGVIDGTGFEIEKTSPSGDSSTPRYASLKGLYPLAGLVNHSCRPNTRRHFTDNDGTMLVVACRDIQTGEEVTTSYCPLLWPTYLRRSFLLKTKQFECACVRCREPTEFDDLLAGIYCSQCSNGVVTPSNSPEFQTCTGGGIWRCRICSTTATHKQMTPILSKLFKTKQRLPPSNFIQLHGSLLEIWSTKKESLSALKNEDLDRRKCLIKDALEAIEKLQLGETRKKGLLLAELHFVLKEMAGRGMIDNVNPGEAKQKAQDILKDDISCRTLFKTS